MGFGRARGFATSRFCKSCGYFCGSDSLPGGYDRSTRGNIAANTSGNDRFITADFSPNKITDYPVNKAGLNFRQVNLSNKQKMQLNELKEKMEVMFRARTKN